MKTKFTTAIIHDGFIYGLDDTILGCLKLENGKQQWKRGRYGHGQVLLANSKLLIQAEDGDVVLAEPNPEAFTELARFPAIEGRTWNTPCLYGNLLLVRNSQEARLLPFALVGQRHYSVLTFVLSKLHRHQPIGVSRG